MTPPIVFIDADLLVVDKPSGVPSVPARTPLDPPDVARRLTAIHGPLEAAHRLDLPHPISGEPLTLAAAPPDAVTWRRFAPAVTAALAAWPIASPSANSGRTGPGR